MSTDNIQNDLLIEAATNGNVELIKETLAAGADVNYSKPNDFGALHYAMRVYPHKKDKDVLACVKLLIEAGADSAKEYDRKETPFATACIEGHLDVVEYLASVGEVDVNARLENGNSLLDELSVKLKNRPKNFTLTRMVEGKQETITDVDEIRKIAGGHPDDEYQAYLAVAAWLLQHGYAVDSVNPNQQSALFTATGVGEYDMLKLLVDHGASVNMQDKWGLTPLHYACRSGLAENVNLFIEAGADLNVGDGWGFTPLHEAVLSNAGEVVKVLMDSGADPMQGITKEYDADHPVGTTPLDIAKKKELTDIVTMLSKG